MTSPTPPPRTYDHKPAYDFMQSMMERLKELNSAFVPVGVRWALVEAYMAGREEALSEARYQEDDANARRAIISYENGVLFARHSDMVVDDCEAELERAKRAEMDAVLSWQCK